jgi:O-antigen biosynthesis protein WbqP
MNGRDRLTISRKAELDGEYVKRISFLFDCRCLIGSILSSILQKDIVEGKQKRK